jgi:predicted O-methyltransferase YrrM
MRLYAITRQMKPDRLVETGVCNGYSTSFLLAALARNGHGRLYSIDLPEVAGDRRSREGHWSGKGSEVVPAGREPGWVIPQELRQRWHLTLGRSQETLPKLLDGLGSIQFFMHDSEHSYSCMSFEYATAYAHLDPGGVIVSDDVRHNTAFADFAAAMGRKPMMLSSHMAFVVK